MCMIKLYTKIQLNLFLFKYPFQSFDQQMKFIVKFAISVTSRRLVSSNKFRSENFIFFPIITVH